MAADNVGEDVALLGITELGSTTVSVGWPTVSDPRHR